ncbi:MAG: putative quinol monooxygenase [Intrasporangium sp.]|uniref:putative quinol monooxygenase n=1 Tax=Intrasporangium sp. TaxID=1925024 RepID=UPI003F7EE431
MYARSTTITAQPDKVDAGIAHLRDEVMPQVRAMDGCVGMSMVVDRSSGRSIVTTAWRSEDALRGSAQGVMPIRERLAQLVGGQTSVEEWEVAYMHREHQAPEGACSRVTWMTFGASKSEEVTEMFRSTVMPKVRELDGFCSCSLFVNASEGRGCITATYDHRDAMVAARDTAMGLRADMVQQLGLKVEEVAEFELCVAHLDVPELV